MKQILHNKEVKCLLIFWQELALWWSCFSLLCAINFFAIVLYDAPFIEMITSLGFIAICSTVLYIVYKVITFTIKLGKKQLENKERFYE